MVGRFVHSFAAGPVVVGPPVEHLMDTAASTREALTGYRAVVGWPEAPRPVSAHDLLPERALTGDGHARRTLARELYDPLQAAPAAACCETLVIFLDQGLSVEAAARALFVHANTVRYRLRRVHEISGYSPTDPRDAYALRLALTLGRLFARAQTGARCPDRRDSRPHGCRNRTIRTSEYSWPRRDVCPEGHGTSKERARHRRARSGRTDPRVPHALADRAELRRPDSTGCPRSPGWTSRTTAPRPTPTPSATPPSRSRCWSPPVCWRRSSCSRTRPTRSAFIGVAAGHSVGEITAAAGVGVLSAEQAMVFVRERGRAMAEASARHADLDDRGDRRQARTRCWPPWRAQG